ncbi:hypothetical protein ACFFRR_009024 [Megaselia abdita]
MRKQSQMILTILCFCFAISHSFGRVYFSQNFLSVVLLSFQSDCDNRVLYFICRVTKLRSFFKLNYSTSISKDGTNERKKSKTERKKLFELSPLSARSSFISLAFGSSPLPLHLRCDAEQSTEMLILFFA